MSALAIASRIRTWCFVVERI